MEETDDQDGKKPDSKAIPARGTKITVLTDLPDALPVLPEEITLVKRYLSDLVAMIAANDDEIEP